MFCSRSNLMVFAALIAGVAPCGAQQIAAQAQVSAPGAGVAVSQTAGVTAGGTVAQAGVTAGAGIATAAPQDDRLDRDTFGRRVVGITAIGVTGSYAARKVSTVAKNSVDLGRVGQVPGWGKAVKALPVFDSVAAKGSVVPTTLGQVPVMGPVVRSIPVAGRIIAGPADPLVVGAVAVDTYVIPKYSPCGYTKSSVIAATNDFNSAPKLRHYVNYLAPLPYSHPPIYSPSTLKTDLPADVAYIDAISRSALTDSIDVPKL